MNVTFRLNVFGYQVSTFDVRLEFDESVPGAQPVVDNAVKRITRRWVRHMAS